MVDADRGGSVGVVGRTGPLVEEAGDWGAEAACRTGVPDVVLVGVVAEAGAPGLDAFASTER